VWEFDMSTVHPRVICNIQTVRRGASKHKENWKGLSTADLSTEGYASRTGGL
jgi:hypothetical protein